jgi:hypothetical protein
MPAPSLSFYYARRSTRNPNKTICIRIWSSYNMLPTNFDFVCKNYRVYMCTPMPYAGSAPGFNMRLLCRKTDCCMIWGCSLLHPASFALLIHHGINVHLFSWHIGRWNVTKFRKDEQRSRRSSSVCQHREESKRFSKLLQLSFSIAVLHAILCIFVLWLVIRMQSLSLSLSECNISAWDALAVLKSSPIWMTLLGARGFMWPSRGA